MVSTFKKVAIIGVLVTAIASMVVAPVAQATTYLIPEVTNLTAFPDPFNPTRENLTIEYHLNYDSNVQVDIYDSNYSHITNLANGYTYSGWNSVTWDGQNPNAYYPYSHDIYPWVADGLYYYEVYAENEVGFNDRESGSFRVSTDGNTNGIDIYNTYIDSLFTLGESSAAINFSIDSAATVEIYIEDQYGSYITNLMSEYKQPGSYTYYWDGINSYGNYVSADYYNVTIAAYNDSGYNVDNEYLTTEARSRGNNNVDYPYLSYVSVSPSVFNPYYEDAELTFHLSEGADVRIEIVESYNGNYYRTINDSYLSSGTHYFYWDGRNDFGSIVGDGGSYEFKIYARNSAGENTYYSETITLEYKDVPGPVIPPRPRPYPPVEIGCAGFYDVDWGTEECDAVSFVREFGIFEGYFDGSFRPYEPINRAEVTKVILEAFNIGIMPPANNNLGFVDIDIYAWYAPFLRTAKNLGIIQGYPDRTFRPANNMNRAELLKTFLSTSGIAIPTCVTSPYSDTRNNAENSWYIDYACFSKDFGLIDPVGYDQFAPDQMITRGEVAKLFYRFYQYGLFDKSITPPTDIRN